MKIHIQNWRLVHREHAEGLARDIAAAMSGQERPGVIVEDPGPCDADAIASAARATAARSNPGAFGAGSWLVWREGWTEVEV